MSSTLVQPNITLIMLKNDAIRNQVTDDIFDRLENAGFQIIAALDTYPDLIEPTELTLEQINEFYKEHIDRPYFADLQNSVQPEIIAAIMEYVGRETDVNAITKMRELIGATYARKALPGTIRGDFGGHKFDDQAPMAANAIHASDSRASMIREIGILFPDLVNLTLFYQDGGEDVLFPVAALQA